jgi:asparagine synthase (glutamine-hydrolysing)
MCGIAGYLGSNIFLPNNKLIKNCSKLMQRRGPDNVNHKIISNQNKSLLLIHSRLSIIDPVKKSNQPMEDENGLLTFNGEIYNYIELKNSLKQKGYKFKTNSDTEVLLKMLSHYKENALNLLDGMWAFAYYNKKDQTLLLSRDRFGEKPLYIYRDKKNIFFGSNINYILSLTKIKPEINYSKIHEFLFGGFRTIGLNEDSFFKNINNLKPSTFLKISQKGYEEKNYWNFKKIKINDNLEYKDAKELIKNTFFESLNRRLRSDFPIACLLSGGIDSNSIIFSSIKKLNIDMKCYSIGNKDKKYDESSIINDTQKKLDLNHNYVTTKKNFSFSEIYKVILDGAYPISSITQLLYYYLNKKINEDKMRVLISGIGSDEIFAGYYPHQMYYLYSSQKKQNFNEVYSDWEKYIKPQVRNKSLNDFNYFKMQIKNQEHVFVANDTFPNNLVKYKNILIPKNKYFKDYFKNQLANDLFMHNVTTQLRDLDQISMYWGIENRSPFLSKDLFELAFSLKNSFLIKNGYGKRILRDSMKGTVSNKILKSRNKVGFNMNIQTLFNIKSKKFKNKIFQNEKLNNYLNLKEIDKILNKNKINNPESHFLFSLLNVVTFLDIYS